MTSDKKIGNMEKFTRLKDDSAKISNALVETFELSKHHPGSKGVLLGFEVEHLRSEYRLTHGELKNLAGAALSNAAGNYQFVAPNPLARSDISKVEVCGFKTDSNRDALVFSKILGGFGLDASDRFKLLILYYTENQQPNSSIALKAARTAAFLTVGEAIKEIGSGVHTEIKRWSLRMMEYSPIKRGSELSPLTVSKLADTYGCGEKYFASQLLKEFNGLKRP